LSLVAATSDPNDAALADEFGVCVVPHENVPLGRKFNAALQASRGAAAVLIMGSDDFFDAVVADVLGEAVLAKRSVGFQDLYVADLPGDRMRYIAGYRVRSRWIEPVGPGTLHFADVLDRLNWRLWPDDKHHSMDYDRFLTLKANKAMPQLLNLKVLGGAMVDVKTEVNMWPFDRTRKQPIMSADEASEIWAQFPADVVDAIQSARPFAGAAA